MSDESAPHRFTMHSSINEIESLEWDACAGSRNPFVGHAFLASLEDSGSVAAETGWIPQHIVFRNGKGLIEAAVPLYAKLHSYGEYVFDQSWAEAFERAGGTYYPKLQGCVPFSPVPGPRLLIRPDGMVSLKNIGKALIQACNHFKMSSVHISFCEQSEWNALADAGWLQRLGMQFHWHNQNYSSFDEFLKALTSSHRKTIRRERRDANNCGLNYRVLRGSEIKSIHWDAFYRFYLSTINRKWGSAYLKREFFTLLSERLGDRVILMVAENNGDLVAGALNLLGDDTLYGRNWGCIGNWPFLHFELCYYRAIDYAVTHNLKHVEAGAQGDHKIQRGYLPEKTYSAHWLAHPGLSHAVEGFLGDEREKVQADIESLASYTPFRRDDTTIA